MIIAVATQGEQVSGHFGHCEGFSLYEQKDGEMSKSKFVPNPGHRPGFLPVFLHDLHVDTVIAGGMGASAQKLFQQRGIDVIVGAEGPVDDVVNAFQQGELKSSGSICEEHQFEGHCHD